MRKININNLLITLTFISLLISIIFGYSVTILAYIDEIIGVLSILVCIYYLLFRKVDRYLLTNLILLCFLIIIGFISTILNMLQTNFFFIALDLLRILKFFTFYLAILYSKKSLKVVLKNLEILSKLLIVFGAIFSLISLFVNVGMSGESRFGLKSFRFIFGFEHEFVMVILASLLIVFFNEVNKRQKYFFLLLSILQISLTLKGPSLIWSATILLMIFYLKKQKKIGFFFLIILLLIAIPLSSYQINTYLTNTSSPRYLLYKYSIVTANSYFPFGSGFGTYGSDMAAKHYSSLYINYGFEGLWGMSSNDGRFLLDNYWPMIIGQFGYFGFFAVICIILLLFKKINNIKTNSFLKAMLISSIIYLSIHSIGSSTFCTSSSLYLIGIIGCILKEIREESYENQYQKKY